MRICIIKYNLAAHTITFSGSLQYMLANNIVHLITCAVEEYRHLIKGKSIIIWERSFSNEQRQLLQGIRDINCSNTIAVIPKIDIPKNKKVTYGKIVCPIILDKAVQESTSPTVGSNLLDFAGN